MDNPDRAVFIHSDDMSSSDNDDGADLDLGPRLGEIRSKSTEKSTSVGADIGASTNDDNKKVANSIDG